MLKSSEGSSSITNPKPRGSHPGAYSGMPQCTCMHTLIHIMIYLGVAWQTSRSNVHDCDCTIGYCHWCKNSEHIAM